MNGTILAADWVIPVTRAPIQSGVVVMRDDRIEAVGKQSEIEADGSWSDYRVVKFAPGTIITPGLINLHSHLDYSLQAFSDCQSTLFPWIEGLMQRTSVWDKDAFLASARFGARQALASGTTFLVDSSYTGQSAQALAESGMKGIVGLELFGLDSRNSDQVWSLWQERLAALQEQSETLSGALSRGDVTFTVAPHAPYTVCPGLWQIASQWALANKVPVLAHLAETQSECNWLQGEEPEIDRFLISVMKSHPNVPELLHSIDWKLDGQTPVGFLSEHKLLTKNLILAHCVFVESADLKMLAEQQVGIAHCPRSNARLRNGRAPVEEYLAAGVRFGLGTDSLASNDDLNLLAEARFALDLHRCMSEKIELKGADMLRILTMEAARLLRLDDQIGSIEPGKAADLAVFELPSYYRTLLQSLKPNNCSRRDEDEVSFNQSDPFATSVGDSIDPCELVVRGCVTPRAVYINGIERLQLSAQPAAEPSFH